MTDQHDSLARLRAVADRLETMADNAPDVVCVGPLREEATLVRDACDVIACALGWQEADPGSAAEDGAVHLLCVALVPFTPELTP